MANEQTEKKYFQKIGIIPTSIEIIKKIIKTNIKNTIHCWNNNIPIEKQTFRVVSPAGIGKTQISLQIAEELTEELKIPFHSILIKAPVLSRDDFLCPFPVIDNGHSRFKMLYSDFVPMEEDSYGLFIIDELSRADTSLQQLLWAVQNECKIHTKNFPKGWFVICLDNPDDQEYGALNEISDSAGLRRVLHLYAEVNTQAFLKYAVKNNFHPLVVDFIQIHPDYLYDFDCQKIGMIYSNPASWERVSNILWGFETSSSIAKNLPEITTLVDGLLNQHMTRLFINFIKDRKDISPKDIFSKYSSVRNDVLKYVEESENVKLGQLIESFVSFLISEKPKYKDSNLENIATFLTDMPPDIGVLFLSKLAKLDSSSPEFRYVTGIHVELVSKSKEYKTNFYEAMIETNQKANAK